VSSAVFAANFTWDGGNPFDLFDGTTTGAFTSFYFPPLNAGRAAPASAPANRGPISPGSTVG
jgi:hypothetical protein